LGSESGIKPDYSEERTHHGLLSQGTRKGRSTPGPVRKNEFDFSWDKEKDSGKKKSKKGKINKFSSPPVSSSRGGAPIRFAIPLRRDRFGSSLDRGQTLLVTLFLSCPFI
jgi:hypothetical protein